MVLAEVVVRVLLVPQEHRLREEMVVQVRHPLLQEVLRIMQVVAVEERITVEL
jgi:hypothetical protein